MKVDTDLSAHEIRQILYALEFRIDFLEQRLEKATEGKAIKHELYAAKRAKHKMRAVLGQSLPRPFKCPSCGEEMLSTNPTATDCLGFGHANLTLEVV